MFLFLHKASDTAGVLGRLSLLIAVVDFCDKMSNSFPYRPFSLFPLPSICLSCSSLSLLDPSRPNRLEQKSVQGTSTSTATSSKKLPDCSLRSHLPQSQAPPVPLYCLSYVFTEPLLSTECSLNTGGGISISLSEIILLNFYCFTHLSSLLLPNMRSMIAEA